MPGDRALAILVAACFALSCGSDSAGPGGNLTASVVDPSGDQFGTDSIQPDLVKMTVTRDTGGITVDLDFAANVQSPFVDPNYGIVGFLDFDTDQDSTTGIETATDALRATGSTGMGEEFFVDFLNPAADSTVFVLDTLGSQTGSVRPVFSGKRVSFRIPRSMLGNDDGFMNVAAIIGSVLEPTDLAPNSGHLKVGGTGSVAPYRPSAPLQSGRARNWGSHWTARTQPR